MGSVRAVKPVKLFIAIAAMADNSLDERLEGRLISEFGPTDHRLSLVSSDGTIQRVFLSFDRLTSEEAIPTTREFSKSLEEQFSAQLDVGFLDNRRAVIGSDDSGDLLQFKDGELQILPSTPPDYRSDKSKEFFLQMRKSFRTQLRSMCLLRK